MASRYQKVTDVEKALQYYEAGLLYRLWPNLSFTENEYLPYDSIYVRTGDDRDFVRSKVRAGHLYILVEEDDSPTNEDEEQPIG